MCRLQAKTGGESIKCRQSEIFNLILLWIFPGIYKNQKKKRRRRRTRRTRTKQEEEEEEEKEEEEKLILCRNLQLLIYLNIIFSFVCLFALFVRLFVLLLVSLFALTCSELQSLA
jgi:hypothetical protein